MKRHRSWNRAAYLTALVMGIGCSADLHDVAGPLIPAPNVTGRVLREGLPANNINVDLEPADVDSTYEDDYTDPEGRFQFDQVPAGGWRVQVSSTEPEDFARVSHDFQLATSDTFEVTPDLEISLGDFEVEEPHPDQIVPVPGFFSPLSFKWRGTDLRLQVRVYRRDDGAPVWFSDKVRDSRVRWNGIGNMPGFEGNAVQAGAYRWRISLDGEGTLQYVTGYRNLELAP